MKMSALAVVSTMLMLSFTVYLNVDGEGVLNSRGSFATHNTGNFTIIIDDDGGATGWNTLEFPSGEDRLSSAYFGIGTGSDKVDFGDHNEFETEDSLTISTPGNYTDEEGYARFSGWNGEDFDGVNITQRTFVNRFEDEVQGHTGRWMIIDYLVEAPSMMDSDAYFIQTMNVDLGASASDDSFSFMEDINTTVISDGTTFVGLGYFSDHDTSRYNGHNAGSYGPGIYSNESNVWGQMTTPNNEPSSATEQDWYMDISAIVQRDDTSSPFHVSYIVLVGSSIFEMREAYFDAVDAMRGKWVGPEIDTWQTGEVKLQFEYDGPFFPPEKIEVHISSDLFDAEDLGPFIPEPVPGKKNMSLSLNTSQLAPDWGDIDWNIRSSQHWGFSDHQLSGSFKADNAGPNTTILYSNTNPRGTLKIDTWNDDRSGSGTDSTYLSIDGEHFIEGGSIEIYDDGADFDIYAYSVDNVGNAGPVSNITDMINDGTNPTIFNLTMDPSDINEDTAGPVTISFEAEDATSGLDHTSAQIQWGIDSILPIWLEMDANGSQFSHTIENQWFLSQGYDLLYTLRISDNLGNVETVSMNETVESMNDLPIFNLTLSGPGYITNEVGIILNGSDEDGDDLNFTFEYQLGNGSWMEVLPELLNWTDPLHCFFEIPGTEFEGPLNIKAFADDGFGRIILDNATILMDTKAPVIGVEGIPIGPWSNDTVDLVVTAVDGISGVFMIGFSVERDGEFEFIPSSQIGLIEDGYHNITIMVQDNAGNSRTLDLDTIKIDLTPPEFEDAYYTPLDPEIGDDLKIYFHASDEMGFDPVKVKQDPSLFIDVLVTFLDNTTRTADAIPSNTEDGLFIINLVDPVTMEYDGAVVSILIRDEAGNQRLLKVGPLNVSDDPLNECPLDLQFPEKVEVGEKFTMEVTWDGPVILEVSYPDTKVTWIISPSRTSGDERTYKLTGPYVPGNIAFKVHYGNAGSKNATSICPDDDWFRIGVTGWIDSDGDGLSDVYEDLYDLNKNKADSTTSDRDKDGFGVLVEMTFLSDPDDIDSDDDGIPDRWEIEMGTIPFIDDSLDDPDNDGWSNWKEWGEGTDPRDKEDHPVDPPVTPLYWMIIIFAVLLAILVIFIIQLFNKRKLEDDLEAMRPDRDWDHEE